jgi:hypothetical protein
VTPIIHEGKIYRVVRGSDVHRDGMFLELWSAQTPETQLFEVFYSDVTNKMEFVCFKQEDVPIEVVEEYLRQARFLLTPTERF